MGVPGITGVWAKQVTDGTVLRVQIHKNYRGHAKQVANALWGSPVSNYAAKMVVVTDDDIDIFDDEAVEWALAYRVNADMGDISFFPGTFGSMLDPSVPLAQRDTVKYGQGKWCRVLIDATMNWELEKQEQYGGQRYPALSTTIDPEDEKLIERRWKEYGI
jgi:4-hydroxy-3-polyprenylbenzoate decarboxylase